MSLTRSYFSYSVILADTSDVDSIGNARLKAISGVDWEVKEVNSDGSVASGANIFGDRTGSPISSTNTTSNDGLIEFWAEPGEYRIYLSHPQTVISDKTITWNSISAQDGAIPGDAISNDNELDLATLSEDVTRQLVPIGAVIDWWRPSTNVAVPEGFVVCSGGTIAADGHDFVGHSGSFVVPDLRNKFILGASTSGSGGGTAGNTAANAPAIGGTGGSNATINLAHTHTIPAHGHSHNISVQSGNANISVNNQAAFNTYNTNIDHNHYVDACYNYGTSTGNLGSYTRVTGLDFGLYTGSSNSYISLNHAHTIPEHGHSITQSGHSHNISGTVGPNTNGDSALTTNATTWTSEVTDVRPAYFGLLKIMKVKRS